MDGSLEDRYHYIYEMNKGVEAFEGGATSYMSESVLRDKKLGHLLIDSTENILGFYNLDYDACELECKFQKNCVAYTLFNDFDHKFRDEELTSIYPNMCALIYKDLFFDEFVGYDLGEANPFPTSMLPPAACFVQKDDCSTPDIEVLDGRILGVSSANRTAAVKSTALF